MQAILECKNLTKSYKGLVALKAMNLSVQPGRILGLLGPNGSGKTTFIKLAAGLLTPTSGCVTIGGELPGVATKKIVSYLPDHNFLNSYMRVEQIVELFSDFYADFKTERAYTMLSSLNINCKMRLKTLSKGNKEKVALILVMSRDARLYLLDEPIAGVDPATRDYILSTILNNYSENASIIISTHLISDIETILDDVVFINNGHIVVSSTVDEIREKEGKSVDAVFREVFRC